MTTEEYERLELWMHEHPPGCTYEYCCECGQPTGNAGRGDGRAIQRAQLVGPSVGGTHLIVELSIPGVKCLIPIAVPSESVGDVVQMMLGRDVAYQDIPPRGRDVCVWKGGDINRALTDAYGFVVRGNAVILSKDVWNHINGY